MSTFVIGDNFASFRGYELWLLLDSADNPFRGELEVHDGDGLFIVSGSDDGGFIADILDVCATKSRS
jgi:hypothetical protein